MREHCAGRKAWRFIGFLYATQGTPQSGKALVSLLATLHTEQ